MTKKTDRAPASEIAKAAGSPSLNYVQDVTGVPRNTLDNWNKNKPALFDTVVAGCNAKLTAPAPVCTWRRPGFHYQVPCCANTSIAMDKVGGMSFCPYCGGRLVLEKQP